MPSRARLHPLTAIACIAVATVITFARALPYPLQRSWDDGRFILDNVAAHTPSLSAFVSFFTRVQFEAYHPLHLLSYWLDVPWSGASPFVIHAVSLGLWVIALALVFAFMRALDLGVSAALLGTLLVGLHPVQVEAVSWATGRKDVLALLFASASLLLHVRAASAWSREAWWSRACFVLAALSKTTVLTLPLFAFTLDVIVRRKSLREALVFALPSSCISLGLGGITVLTWQDSEMVRGTLGGVLAAPLRLLGTLAHQLGTAVWPSHVSPMYSTQALNAPTLGWLAWPALLVGAGMFARRERIPIALAGFVGFVILLLPVGNLVPMYFPFQDRYLSLPLLALGLAVAALFDAWHVREKSQAALGLFALLVLATGTRTYDYAGMWSSELRLWGHAASAQPDAEYAWLKLASVRRDHGDFEGAISVGRVLVQVAPSHRLNWAALFESVALRDERNYRLAPPRARDLAKRFYESLDDADALRELASFLLANGYVRTLELPLAHSLVLAKVPDAALEHAAKTQLKNGRPSIARCYVERMQKPTLIPELAALERQPYFAVLP